MISQIEGKIRRLLDDRIEIEVSGLTYEVLLPSRAYQQLRSHDLAQPVRLYTFHYLEGAMTAAPIPRLVGFLSELDRDFFHLLRTVKNIGAKTALASMILPVSQYARAIENEDIPSLKGLPEVGPATAKRMIAELKGKLVRFLFMPDEGPVPVTTMLTDYRAEAVEVLLQLGKRRSEAEDWVARAARQFPDIKESDRLLTEVFKLFGMPGG
jgi:Holliday junction DNA helicase RuvA